VALQQVAQILRRAEHPLARHAHEIDAPRGVDGLDVVEHDLDVAAVAKMLREIVLVERRGRREEQGFDNAEILATLIGGGHEAGLHGIHFRKGPRQLHGLLRLGLVGIVLDAVAGHHSEFRRNHVAIPILKRNRVQNLEVRNPVSLHVRLSPRKSSRPQAPEGWDPPTITSKRCHSAPASRRRM
jgi:hypothetical protein